MARLAVGALFGIVVGVLAGAALGVKAGEDVDQAELEDAAAEAHVDVVDLLGAVNTTGMAPRPYLRAVGELPPLPSPVSPVWDKLAGCESTSNWHANTGNGYSGGVQMDAAFWSNHGGLAYAPAPWLASREQQIQVAINGRDGLVGRAQGWGAWPVCSRRLGLR